LQNENEGNLKEINFEGNVNEILEERRKFEGKSKISPKLVIFNSFASQASPVDRSRSTG
jgi:hypothetical protein